MVAEAGGPDEVIAGEGVDGPEADADAVAVALVDSAPGKKAAASLGFEERKPAVKSPAGHARGPHGTVLQHPMNGGVLAAQVYQRLPLGHSWSGNWP